MRTYQDFVASLKLSTVEGEWRFLLSGKEKGGQYSTLKKYDQKETPDESDVLDVCDGYAAYRIFFQVQEQGGRWTTNRTFQKKLDTDKAVPATAEAAAAQAIGLLAERLDSMVRAVMGVVETQNKVIDSLGVRLTEAHEKADRTQEVLLELLIDVATATDEGGADIGDSLDKLSGVVGKIFPNGVPIEMG